MDKRKKIILAVVIVLVILALIFIARFLIGGSEDSWIYSAGQWIKHGNPSAPMPSTACN